MPRSLSNAGQNEKDKTQPIRGAPTPRRQGRGQAESVNVRVRGAGNVSIAGQTDHLVFDMNGAGAGKLAHLCTKNAKVKLVGTGKITVNARISWTLS